VVDLTWRVELLHREHDRAAFDCGESELNSYLQKFANQHARHRLSRTYVMVATELPNQIWGFYTLSTGSITHGSLPPEWRKKLPTYPIPVARIGRLAVDKMRQGTGLGELLLKDALWRCANLSKEIGLFSILVDAKHEKAKAFYLKYGFRALIDQPLSLYLPISSLIAALPGADREGD